MFFVTVNPPGSGLVRGREKRAKHLGTNTKQIIALLYVFLQVQWIKIIQKGSVGVDKTAF